jgi:hypothetical protein
MGRRGLSFLLRADLQFQFARAGWPLVRDAQRRTLVLRNTGMAVTLDVGTPDNVHPPDKQTVGNRLALAARATVYGEKIEYSSPEFLQATTEPNAMRVWFTHGEGLTTMVRKWAGLSWLETTITSCRPRQDRKNRRERHGPGLVSQDRLSSFCAL